MFGIFFWEKKLNVNFCLYIFRLAHPKFNGFVCFPQIKIIDIILKRFILFITEFIFLQENFLVFSPRHVKIETLLTEIMHYKIDGSETLLTVYYYESIPTFIVFPRSYCNHRLQTIIISSIRNFHKIFEIVE